MTSSMTYHIHIPGEFYDSCKEETDRDELLTETCGEYITIGSYDFLISQARYFAWPHLTYEILAGVLVHEDAHNTLTMATALGHLELHIKAILEFTNKIPPNDMLTRAFRRYLGIIIGSSIYAQETAATMLAYTALWKSYGLAVADQYLEKHKRKVCSVPSPYTTFVERAIDLFRKHYVPSEHWAGYMNFLASLAMNTDINEIVASLPEINRFEELCARSPLSADLRFVRLFREFEDSMEKRGLPTEKKNFLEHNYNKISKVVSSDFPRLLAEALLQQAAEFGLNDYDRVFLDQASRNHFGFPGKTEVQTVFYAAQPQRRATAENYLFHMDDDACTECDLVEIGLASFYENVTYGGISMNFYVTNSPPIKTGFWMLHPCCATRCHLLLDNKTLVVYYTHSLIMGDRAVEPIRKLINGRRVIYIFFGNHGKFLSWTKEREGHLAYAIAETQRPPVRFVLLRDRRDGYSTYVLPIAPVRCAPIDDILSTIECVTLSEFADTDFLNDLTKFFRWYVFAPVTC